MNKPISDKISDKLFNDILQCNISVERLLTDLVKNMKSWNDYTGGDFHAVQAVAHLEEAIKELKILKELI